MLDRPNKRSLMAGERIVIDFSQLDDNFAFLLGRVNYSKAHPPLGRHLHKGAMEIVYIVKGKQCYSVGGDDFTVAGGEVFITYADEPHSSSNYPEEKALFYYLIMDVDRLVNALAGYDEAEGKFLSRALSNLKKRVFKGCAGMKTTLDGLVADYYGDSPVRKMKIRDRISSFLISLLECEGKSSPNNSTTMNLVLNHIEKNIYEEIRIDTLAGIANLSVARFKSSFRKQMGIPPHEYILRQKIECACRLLKSTEMSITEMAYQLNFSSSQYFSTVFKRFTFKSPSEYRAVSRNHSAK